MEKPILIAIETTGYILALPSLRCGSLHVYETLTTDYPRVSWEASRQTSRRVRTPIIILIKYWRSVVVLTAIRACILIGHVCSSTLWYKSMTILYSSCSLRIIRWISKTLHLHIQVVVYPEQGASRSSQQALACNMRTFLLPRNDRPTVGMRSRSAFSRATTLVVVLAGHLS